MILRLRSALGARHHLCPRWHELPMICGLLVATITVLVTAASALGQESEGFRDALGLLDAWAMNRSASRLRLASSPETAQPSLTSIPCWR